jgi:hypothetical protein
MSDDFEYDECWRWDATSRNALQLLPPLAVVPDITAPTSSHERLLIMHDGVEDGVIMQSEYLVAELSIDHTIWSPSCL